MTFTASVLAIQISTDKVNSGTKGKCCTNVCSVPLHTSLDDVYCQCTGNSNIHRYQWTVARKANVAVFNCTPQNTRI